MLRNYLNIALRSFKRQRAYSLINIVGLSTGVMACIIIMLYVRSEASYEKFYPEAEKIHRLTSVFKTSGEANQIAVSPRRATLVAQSTIPETLEMTHMMDFSVGREFLVEIGDKRFVETSGYYADSSYFKVFQHRFVEGSAESALNSPDAVVLPESVAEKFFGRTDNIVGEIIRVNSYDYKVTGVIEDFPGKTSLEFNMLFEMTVRPTDRWFPMNFFTYVKLEGGTETAFINKLNDFIDDEVGEQFAAQGMKMNFEIQPLSEIHFDTSKASDYPEKISKNLVFSLLAIAAFILLIACINYINLSTAKSEKRAKEVGIRKVLGAQRKQLIWQFYGETFMITLVAVTIGVVLAELIMPFFNGVADTDLIIDLTGDRFLLPSLVGLVLVVSFISGSYPASFLSSFQPVKVLKGTFSVKGGSLFRRALVTLQFAVSVFLVVGTLIIYFQMDYVTSKDVGYDQEQIVYMRLADGRARRAYPAMKDAFENLTGVEQVTGSNNMISNVLAGWGAVMEGLPEDVSLSFKGMYGDQDFLETFGFDLIAGESFQNKSDWDSTIYYLVNKTGIDALGITPEEAIGKRFGLDETVMGTIVGVIEDFHLASMHKDIEPLAIYTGPQNYKNLLYARVNMQRIEQLRGEMRTIWEQFNPNRPFDMQFLNVAVRELYEKDQRLGKIILTFTVLAILIGGLGLFGLASYLAEKRTKEIGIRKVLGADVSRIMVLLSSEYLKIILIANIIAWPVAYLVMNRWLEAFAYRINVSWYYFLLAAAITIIVALITVSYQSIKAAISNPIKALRYE